MSGRVNLEVHGHYTIPCDHLYRWSLYYTIGGSLSTNPGMTTGRGAYLLSGHTNPYPSLIFLAKHERYERDQEPLTVKNHIFSQISRDRERRGVTGWWIDGWAYRIEIN